MISNSPSHGSRRVPAMATILCLTLGCGDDGAAPTGRELVGAWGSLEAQLIALHAGAELRAGCTRFIIDDPIALTDDDKFSSQARVDGSGAALGDLPVVRLTGSQSGSRVRIFVPQSAHTSAATYILMDAVAPAPSQQPQCPL